RPDRWRSGDGDQPLLVAPVEVIRANRLPRGKVIHGHREARRSEPWRELRGMRAVSGRITLVTDRLVAKEVERIHEESIGERLPTRPGLSPIATPEFALLGRKRCRLDEALANDARPGDWPVAHPERTTGVRSEARQIGGPPKDSRRSARRFRDRLSAAP